MKKGLSKGKKRERRGWTGKKGWRKEGHAGDEENREDKNVGG